MKPTLTLSQRKRAAIVDAAIDEFKKSGFAATSMDTIAERARVSKRTVYNHFDSKESLFGAISDSLCSAVIEVMDVDFDPDGSMEGQLYEFAIRQIELCCSDKFMTMARVTLPERLRNPDLANPSFDRIRNGETGLAFWMEQAVAAKALNVSDVASASRQFSALLLEFTLWPQLFAGEPTPKPAERKKIAHSAVKLFLDGVRT
ncbi:TetR/AcrR family transcriptional regulator [Verrucomicrobiaceae bacterium 227]